MAEAANNGFDPTAYARIPARSYVENAEGDAKPDKAGRPSRGQTFAQRVTLPDGFAAILYSMYAGHPWMNPERTRIEIPIQGYIRIEGRWAGGHDHESLLVISGKNLDQIFDQITAGRREFTHPCRDAEDGTAVVDAIEVEPMPE